MKKHIFILLVLLRWISADAQKKMITLLDDRKDPPYEVEGKVFSAGTGEPIVGANIFIERQNIGTSTDSKGIYLLELFQGTYIISVSNIGYKSQVKTVNVLGSGIVNFLLDENIPELNEVIIRSELEDKNVRSTDLGKDVLTLKTMRTLPPLAGEVDVLKSLTLLPGVSSQGEVSGGFNVRGGGSDQNLILLGGATLYNPTHLFGFFSSFNASIVRDVQLYKGAVPANFGGRGSSIVDISYNKGNLYQWEGNINLGIVSSSLTVGGPVVPGKISVLLGGRGSYINWLLQTTSKAEISNSAASFRDGNLILSYAINESNELEYSFYGSYDEFNFAGDTSTTWQTNSHVLKWTSVIGSRLTISLSGISNNYYSAIISTAEFDQFELANTIDHNELNLNFKYDISQKQSVNIGGQIKDLKVNPGTLVPGNQSSLDANEIETENAIESGIYFQHDVELNNTIAFSYGLRYSDFRLLGKGSVNQYAPLSPRRPENVIGTKEYVKNELIQRYGGIEPRASFKYQFNDRMSFKIGYNRMFQYIHLVSNSTSIFPTDVWKLSDPFLKPEIVTQYSLGIFRNFNNNRIEMSVEGYYKDWDNVVEYVDGADLFLNANLETELISGIGKSYGVEFFFKKKQGRLNGWVSYTYSRSLRLVEGAFKEETINDGNWYPSNFDKPHDFTVVSGYRLGPLTTFNAIFSYSTGRPVTYPDAKLSYAGSGLGYFTERNSRRAPDFHRLDLSLQFELPTKIKILTGVWTFSIYNVYGRKNPYSVFFADVANAPPQPFKLTIVGAPFPALSYQFEF